MSFRLDPDVVEALRRFGKARRMSMNAVVNHSLRVHLAECAPGGPETATSQRAQIVFEQSRQAASITALGEQLRLFILTWFTHTPPVPAAHRSDAVEAARKRHDAFEAGLLRRLQEPKSETGEAK